MHFDYNSKIYIYNPMCSNNAVNILIEQLALSYGLWELNLIRLTSMVNEEHGDLPSDGSSWSWSTIQTWFAANPLLSAVSSDGEF